jgi:FMN phosphatase YigB (HAD superfamily)
MSSSFQQCRVLTFDALGTLYRFKSPVAEQYLNVARERGVHVSASADALLSSFKQAYRNLNREHPNYGVGKLSSPQVWWEKLVHDTFTHADPVVSLPHDLGTTMYHHFSSGAAYELFPDVRGMLQKWREHDRSPVTAIRGIITNSDPRVDKVLHDLGVRVGNVRIQQGRAVQEGFDAGNDFDFICTSYEATSEKPSADIFQQAHTLVDAVDDARGRQPHIRSLGRDEWVHIGDDLTKDFQGAREAGLVAILVQREALSTDELEATEQGQLATSDLSNLSDLLGT